jgi:hypothetical protein
LSCLGDFEAQGGQGGGFHSPLTRLLGSTLRTSRCRCGRVKLVLWPAPRAVIFFPPPGCLALASCAGFFLRPTCISSTRAKVAKSSRIQRGRPPNLAPAVILVERKPKRTRADRGRACGCANFPLQLSYPPIESRGARLEIVR